MSARRVVALGAALSVAALGAMAAAQTPPTAWTAPAPTTLPPAVPPGGAAPPGGLAPPGGPAQPPPPGQPTAPPTSTAPPATAPTVPPPPSTPPPTTFPSNVQAGGLAPPGGQAPPTTPTAEPTKTEKDLDEAKEKDSKRGLEWVWINAEGGFSHVDMQTFVGNEDFTFGFIPTQATGGIVGLGLGVRLLFVTLGARARVGFYEPWQLFTVGGELGFHIPISRLDIHFGLGGGYAGLGNATALVEGAKDAISIQGGYGRVLGGLDVYITPIFSVGVQASGDFLALIRPGLSPEKIAEIKGDPSITAAQEKAADGLGAEGSSFGTAVGVTGVLGLHF